ncbi:hypothetical protein M2132_001030 [Dysgonomonas sp. PH5-45]|uniref:hypothetical protein n=1 Tax=unclassified Dysgonomonas TaxID=2630389 RepID=UPI002476CC83|nr:MULTISPECIES: hypothetical protein [unclassified Dysgonomonas]MDH6354701.1 hypothetical protein [Dysgonomonas sp. PH5-45]MDH6387599.1 hypothetical protein [Dysgonomonas sp. PH5-37]
MNEKLLERKLVAACKKLGCKAIKFSSFYDTGYPDREILIPGGFTWWREIKTTGEEPSLMQKVKIKLLQDMGFNVGVIDSQESLDQTIRDLETFLKQIGYVKKE